MAGTKLITLKPDSRHTVDVSVCCSRCSPTVRCTTETEALNKDLKLSVDGGETSRERPWRAEISDQSISIILALFLDCYEYADETV